MEIPFCEDASKDSRGHRTGVSSILETASVASNLKIAGIKHLTGLQHRTSGQLCEPSPGLWNSPVPSQHPLKCSFRGRREVLLHLLINQFLGLLRLHRIGRGDVFAAPQSLRRSIDGDRPPIGQALFIETLPEIPVSRYPPIWRSVTVPSKFFSPFFPNPARRLSSKEYSSSVRAN